METDAKRVHTGHMAISLRPSQALRLWQLVALSGVRDSAPDLTLRQMTILLTVYLDPPPGAGRNDCVYHAQIRETGPW